MNTPMLDTFHDALRSIVQYMDIHSRSLDKQIGVTAPQLSILAALGNGSPMIVSELSNKVFLSVGTISGTIDRLEKKGLVERVSSNDDKRKTYIHLTSSGRKILESGASPLPVNFIQKLENSVPDWEKTMILSSFLRVAHLMQENGCD